MQRILMSLIIALWAGATQAQTLSCKEISDRKTRSCDAVMKVIDRELVQMKKPDQQMQLDLIAKAIRMTDTRWGTTQFTLGDDGLAGNYCCSCVPGEDCSAENINDVCSPAPSGADGCPAGNFRAICTGQFCTGID